MKTTASGMPQGQAMKRTIGSVGFAKPGTNWAEPHMGDERVALLKLARAGQPLPDDLHLVAQRDGGGYEAVTADQVDWQGMREVAFEVRTILAGIYTPILKHSGCTTEEVSSALDAIRQAYRAGVVDRDCFRALCEHAPLLTKLMAEYLCMPSAAYLRSYMHAWSFTYPLCTMAKVVGQWKP
jgi:tape measure domain-containing protein